MKIKLIVSLLSSLFGLAGAGFTAAAFGSNVPGPYVNGAASAQGQYLAQSDEDKVTGSSGGGLPTGTETSSGC